MKQATMMKNTLNKIYNPVIKESIYYTKLDNGLPVYILPKKGFKQKYAIFATKYGSIDDKFKIPGSEQVLTVPDGIAHFLEHKMFEDKEVNVFDKFAAYGANVNAYTTYTSTSYLFDTIENFDECLELLLDFVQKIYLTTETVEKEKGIIEQEILMYDDDPEWVSYLNLMRALYYCHPVRIDIAGTVESIYEINQDLLTMCYHTFYHPSNMLLFIQGDLDPEQVLRQVQANQERKNYVCQPPIERIYPDEPLGIHKSRTECYMAVSRPIYNLGFKERLLRDEGEILLKRDLLTNMLLEVLIGKGSELYQKLYEQALIDDSFAVSYTAEYDHGMTVLGGQTNDTERLHAALVEGIKAKMGHITIEELERVRKRMIGDYITTFDSLKSTSQSFVVYYFRNMDIFTELDILKSITLEDLEERLREHFDFDYHAVSIVYPSNKKDEVTPVILE